MCDRKLVLGKPADLSLAGQAQMWADPATGLSGGWGSPVLWSQLVPQLQMAQIPGLVSQGEFVENERFCLGVWR